jgi:hypothetical protein
MDGITIMRAVTCDARAALPEELFGLPVTALGDHALAPAAREADGEAVLVTCGPVDADAAWDNRQLRELTLPATLKQVGDYALLNCGALTTLRLHDSVTRWGASALMNCRLLNAIHITWETEQGDALAYFADELSRELDVTIAQADGQRFRLIFPEYLESYEENCPAHHFDYNIYGAGYPYHHCFRQRRLYLQEYDALWAEFLRMEHEDGTALRLAWWRLRYPVELAEAAEAQYLDYLQAHTAEAARWLLEQRDTAGLQFLLNRTEVDEDALSAACAQARSQGMTEALAMLLEARHLKRSGGLEKSFDL